MSVNQVGAGTRRSTPGSSVTAALCVMLSVTGAVSWLLADASRAFSGHVYQDVVLGIVWALLGATLSRRVPGSPFGPLFLVIAASAGLAVAAGGWATLAGTTGLPGALPAAWLSGWVWTVSAFAPVVLLPMWFPDTPVRSAAGLAVAGTGAVGVGLVTVAAVTEERVGDPAGQWFGNPLAVEGSAVLAPIGQLLVAVAALGALTALAVRLRRSSGERRRQIVPVLVAVVLSTALLVVAVAVPARSALVQLPAALLPPLAVATSILRYRLYDLEWVARRSVVFLGFSALIVVAYLTVVVVAGQLVSSGESVLVGLLTAALVGLAAHPVRIRLQRLVSRSLYGERDSPRRALAGLGSLLAGAADPQSALPEACREIASALRLPWVGIRVVDRLIATSGPAPVGVGTVDRTAATSGPAPVGVGTVDRTAETSGPGRVGVEGTMLVLPLLHLGAQRGELLVAPRGPHDRLSRRDRRVLAELAVPVAAVLEARILADQLRRSREQLALARADERRLLRRDLHDGLGPLLSATLLQADVVRLRLARGSASTSEALDRLRQTGEEALGALRGIVGQMGSPGPAAGLWAALSDLSESMTTAYTVVTTTSEPVPGVPVEIESTALLIAGEAIANAVRHAGATRINVHVGSVGQMLSVLVADDGTGFDPQTVYRGVGLNSMAERAAEVDGRLDLESGPTGTRVVVLLPLKRSEPG